MSNVTNFMMRHTTRLMEDAVALASSMDKLFGRFTSTDANVWKAMILYSRIPITVARKASS